ncbi:MAG: response regulator transcription factor [Bacteroidetes bacterium]|nr:response regulator transcription factor [Bacteroidota bacterium]
MKPQEPERKILIVEDNKDVVLIVQRKLNRANFHVDAAHDGVEALEKINGHEYELIILDISLPKKSGLEVLKEIREKGNKTPVLILSGLNEVEDKVKGLKYGADDYLGKPFEPKELIARIEAILRRSNATSDMKLRADNLELDLIARKVSRDGKEIDLSPKEFSLLEYLMKHKNEVVSRQQIAQDVWGYNFDTGTNYVDVYINYLRNSIDKNHEKKLIQTIFGKGFMLKDE